MNRLVFEFGYFVGLARLAWHTDAPSPLLVMAHDSGWLAEGARVLEVGCGLGTNTQWLAEHRFDVTGIDLSKIAVSKVRRKLARNGLRANVYQANFLEGLREEQFDVVFDRATLHSFPVGPERTLFAQRLAEQVRPGGLLLLAEMRRVPEHADRRVPPFGVELEDLRDLFGGSFDISFIGEEHQRHRVLGDLPFGQWRVLRREAANAKSEPQAGAAYTPG